MVTRGRIFNEELRLVCSGCVLLVHIPKFMLPVRRHVGDERASAKEISLFLCGFRARAQRFPRQRNWTHTCECGHPTSDSCKSRNYWVSSHTSNFSTIGHSDPEIQRWGCTCARAEIPHPTHDLWKALT